MSATYSSDNIPLNQKLDLKNISEIDASEAFILNTLVDFWGAYLESRKHEKKFPTSLESKVLTDVKFIADMSMHCLENGDITLYFVSNLFS